MTYLRLSSELREVRTTPEERLAVAVVMNAVDDYQRARRYLTRFAKIKFPSSRERDGKRDARRDMDLAVEFLEGRSDIAKFWLTAASLPIGLDARDIVRRKEIGRIREFIPGGEDE